jgi:hypothetical protein
MSPCRKLCILSLVAVLAAPHASSGAAGDAEDELKSATVLSFLRYTTWPAKASAGVPLIVGVLGRSGFIRTLGALLEGKSVEGRPVRLVEIKPGVDPRCCQVLYFATDKKSDIEPALASAAASHVLTIGEGDRFLEYGGSVNLMVVDGHMAFEVNMDALERSGVDISSKLLRLGQIKKRRGA